MTTPKNAKWIRPKTVTHADEKASWEIATLGEFVATRTKGIVPNKTPATTFELYSVPSLEKGAPEIIRGAEIGSNKQIVEVDTVLLCKINPRINRSWVVSSHTTHQKIASTEWITFPPSEAFEPKYLAHYLKQDAVRDFLAANASGVGGSLMRVKPATLKDYPFQIAPPEQQKRIVAEIEKQFSRLDEAVANLKRIKANLKRYKAAVLKAAVEGKLTEDWRKAHPNVEPATKLLDRILTERRAKWKGKGKYKEPGEPETSNLPELPETWVWARLDAIAALKGGITVDRNRKSSTARSVPYLRVANVQRGYLDLSEVKTIEAPITDIKDLKLLAGDILFNEGGDRDKLGRGWIWEGQLPECIHQNHVFRARLYLDEVSPKLVSWWGNSFGQAYFLREGKQTTNLASLNLTKLSAFPIPLSSASEQNEIVAEVERRLSVIDELEATVEANLTRADRLRQSILQQAFSGKLIHRDRLQEPHVAPEIPLAAESLSSYGAIS